MSFEDLGAFERTRRGNCRSHAQWAFAQLARLGHNPSLIVGRRELPSGHEGGHAWVQFSSDGEEFLLEGMEEAPDAVLGPLTVRKHEYTPYYGASASGAEFVFPAYVKLQMNPQAGTMSHEPAA